MLHTMVDPKYTKVSNIPFLSWRSSWTSGKDRENNTSGTVD